MQMQLQDKFHKHPLSTKTLQRKHIGILEWPMREKQLLEVGGVSQPLCQ